MSYANIFELQKSLDDCLAYCQEHPDREHVEYHAPILRKAQQTLDKTTDKAADRFTDWRMENREDQLAWKHLAKELRSVQKQLDAVNAIGYIDQKIMYWARKPLVAGVEKMMEYLRERQDVLDFAEEAADKLERQLRKARDEDKESDRALDEYLRFSKMRSDGLSKAKEAIANFRKTLRRDLGRRDEDYQSIRWPLQVAPDQRVL